MASPVNLYRRGNLFWWQHVHRLFTGQRIRVRLSLRTGDRREATDRGVVLTSLKGKVTTMLNDRMRAADATLTEADLQAIAKVAYGELLGRTCDEQRQFPHHFEMHSAANLSWADYYQRQVENGGQVLLLDGEEQALRFRGWDAERIARLRAVIEVVIEGSEPIKSRFIDVHLREAGFEPSDARRRIVRRALNPAYRDACLEAEKLLQSAFGQQPKSGSSAYAAPDVAMDRPSVPSDAAPVGAVDAGPRMSEITQRASNELIADEAWGAKSGRQLRSTVELFELLIGPQPFASLTQNDLARFKRKLRFVPKIYSMRDPRSRKAVLEAVSACEAAEKANGGKASKATYSLSNRTLNRHLSSLSTLHVWARANGFAVPPLFFDQLQTKSKRDRSRNQRPAVSIDDVGKLFALPSFCGSRDHAGGTGQIVLRARKTAGLLVAHDAFYWVPLLLYYTGARREEICKLSVDDVHTPAAIPYIVIDFTEFGSLKNEQSIRPVPLHSELIRLGFIAFVMECQQRGYRELFPELRPTNAVQSYGDVYYKVVWRHLRQWGGLATEATLHGLRHRFSSSLKTQQVFSEFRRDLMGQAGLNIAEERYSENSGLGVLKEVVEKMPSATAHLQAAPLYLPPASQRRAQPNKKRNV